MSFVMHLINIFNNFKYQLSVWK